MSRQVTAPRSASTALLLILLSFSPLSVSAEVDEVSELLSALGEEREGAQVRAASRLYQIGAAERAVPRVVRRLQSEDPADRALAARLLGLLRSEAAAEPLLSAIDDQDWAVRRDAIEALGQIGVARAADRIAARLADPHPRVRASAATAMADLDRSRGLADALGREEDREVRLHLVTALGRVEQPATTAVLRRLLADEAESIRVLAATYLVERGEPEAARVLEQRLDEGRPERVRREAAEALARARGEAVEVARRSLFAACSSPSVLVGLAAAEALVRLGDPRGRQQLDRIARSDVPPHLRARALALLETLGGL